ncbi:hypothetical protein [Streptomyces sp. NPDC086023]|uniref:hypothetical protein n=1 Tax=Streptomyces sp. NPDC086023 TaxID=3365746 RepID=UPI0037D0D161
MSLPPDELRQRSLDRLARYITEAEEILASWDAYSDQHTDADGWPHDATAYDTRQRRRDADTWRAFTRIRSTASSYLLTADRQLRQLPGTAAAPQWAWQLKELRTSLDAIHTLQAEWLATLNTPPEPAVPGTEAWAETQAERNSEAWHHLYTWAGHGHAVLDIHTDTQHHRPPAVPTTTAVATTPVPRPVPISRRPL